MILDLRAPFTPFRNWFDQRREAFDWWYGGYRQFHWWFAWRPIFVDSKLVWWRWVVRSYNTRWQRAVDRDYRRPPLGIRKWSYILKPSPHRWHDRAPIAKLFLGENPNRLVWRNGYFGDFTETKFLFARKA